MYLKYRYYCIHSTMQSFHIYRMRFIKPTTFINMIIFEWFTTHWDRDRNNNNLSALLKFIKTVCYIAYKQYANNNLWFLKTRYNAYRAECMISNLKNRCQTDFVAIMKIQINFVVLNLPIFFLSAVLLL